jgi:hypothetical protein
LYAQLWIEVKEESSRVDLESFIRTPVPQLLEILIIEYHKDVSKNLVQSYGCIMMCRFTFGSLTACHGSLSSFSRNSERPEETT